MHNSRKTVTLPIHMRFRKAFVLALLLTFVVPAVGVSEHGSFFEPIKQSNVSGTCIGEEFEQPIPEPEIQRPQVSLDSPTDVDEEDMVTVSATGTVDMTHGGLPFFSWCTDKGLLFFDESRPDHSVVFFEAPRVPGSDDVATIRVRMGDNLGYIAVREAQVRIREIGNHDPSDPAPSVSITNPDTLLAGEVYGITFNLSDQDALGADTSFLLDSDIHLMTSDGIRSPILQGINGNASNYLWVPQVACIACRIELTSTDGNSRTTAQSSVFDVVSAYGVRGSVTVVGGEPLAGARVTIDGDTTAVSSASGSYHVSDLEEGWRMVAVSKPGYNFASSSQWVNLRSDNAVPRVDFVGTRDGSSTDISIDIKPGSDVNPINLRSRGKIPVAILSSSAFNAPTRIDPLSLTFGHTGDEVSLHFRGNGQPNCAPADVNDDGLDDLMCHFLTQVAAFQGGDTKGFLKGHTTDGEPLEAMDTITIVGNGFDSDADGVPDDTEDEAPNNGDANGDGLFDSFQENVTSLTSALTGEFITLVSDPGCVNVDVLAVDAVALPVDPEGFHTPQGLLSFVLESCGTSDVSVILHGESNPSIFEYRRFGPTRGQRSDHWYTLPAGFEVRVIDSTPVIAATFHLEDGGEGDDDLAVDGRIVDPGGPGVRGAGVLAIPTLSGLGLVGLVTALLAVAFVLLARRRRSLI